MQHIRTNKMGGIVFDDVAKLLLGLVRCFRSKNMRMTPCATYRIRNYSFLLYTYWYSVL